MFRTHRVKSVEHEDRFRLSSRSKYADTIARSCSMDSGMCSRLRPASPSCSNHILQEETLIQTFAAIPPGKKW